MFVGRFSMFRVGPGRVLPFPFLPLPQVRDVRDGDRGGGAERSRSAGGGTRGDTAGAFPET